MITVRNTSDGQISERIKLTLSLNNRQPLLGKLNYTTKEIKPELENIKIIPKTEQQEFESEKYGYDKIIVEPVTSSIDEDIKPENIKKGTNILGIEGGYEGIDTSDATATAADILKDKTAYVNNIKIIGNIEKYDGSYNGGILQSTEINNASYLFYLGARTNILKELLLMCKGVTSTEYMFYSCSGLTELDLSNFNTSEVRYMRNMFKSCTKLAELNVSNWKTTNTLDMDSMFYECYALTELDLSSFDTSNLTNISNMFYKCIKLTNLNLSSFDMQKVQNVDSSFYKCSELINFKSFKNLGKAYNRTLTSNVSKCMLSFNSCTKLTYESLMDIINNLYDLNLTYDVANGGTLYTQKLVLGSVNVAKLTAEEIAIATNKGWTVS